MKNILKIGVISTLILLSLFDVKAQRSPLKHEVLISGYHKKVAGNEIKYNSGLGSVSKALITRADNGKKIITWESAAVDSNAGNSFVTFVYYVGYDSHSPGTVFHFYVGNIKYGEIVLPDNKSDKWTLKLKNNTELSFERNFVDGNDDVFGFLYYKVPVENLKTAQKLQFEITGSDSNKMTWFMLFKMDLSESLKLETLPAILKKDGKEYQPILVEINYLKPASKAKLIVDGTTYREIEVKTGRESVEVLVPKVTKEKTIKIRLANRSINMESSILLKPVRKWQAYFVQHTHTDIGYSRSQMEILGGHLRYIDYALDYCDATDNYPEASKFRWTCEASWAVDEFLKSRPKSQIERLKRRIDEGRIEVTGMYFNFTELPDEQTLAASLAPIKSFMEEGIPITSAMQNDVNGIAWCLNDYFNTLGVKYLNMGTHGHRALISFNNPTAFWWVSPSGKKMLAFRAEHYQLGNSFGIHTTDFRTFEKKFLSYLNDLNDRGYPYNLISVQHSGFVTDNSPPSVMASDMIRKWNKKYEWPKIKTAVISDFFKDIEREYGDSLIEIKGNWPDWWADGLGSAAREVAASRDASVDFISGMGGLAMAKLMGAQMPKDLEHRIYEVNNALLFYNEHTFGAAESISDPYGKASMEQRAIKESYAWEALRRAKMLDEEALGLLNNYISKEDKPVFVAYNTLNWERNGLVTLFIDHQQVPVGKKMRLIDENDNYYPAQILKPWHGGSYWSVWAENIPPFGYRKFIMDVYDDTKAKDKHTTASSSGYSVKWNYTDKNHSLIVENKWYSIVIDKTEGAITRIYDKKLQKDLVDENAKYKLGTFVMEQLGDREQLQNTMLPNGSRFGHLTDFLRHPLDSVWFSEIQEGEIWNTIRFKGKTTTALDEKDAYTFEIRVFNTTKRIDFAYQLKKKPITDPESFYISFPFQLNDGKIFLEIAGGVVEAGVDQIPGSSNDWNTIQNFVSVKNKKEQLVLVSQEAPLMQFGDINTGRFEYNATPKTTHIYSWPMNNYWVTAFNANQRGMFTWTYNFTSFAGNDNKNATKFSWGLRIPLLARVLPIGKENKSKKDKLSILRGIPDNILIVSVMPLENENAVLFQLREVAGKSSTFLPESLHKDKEKWFETNVNGTVIKSVNQIDIDALETKFFKLTW